MLHLVRHLLIQCLFESSLTFQLPAALAAVTCLRSLAGFAFPLFAPAMYKALGFGKGNTILAVVAIVIGCPACVACSLLLFVDSIVFLGFFVSPWLFWHFGERIRKNSKYAQG